MPENNLPFFREDDLQEPCPKCGYSPTVGSERPHTLQYLSGSETMNKSNLRNTLAVRCGRCGGPVAGRRALDNSF
jgi:endogenous inhibitor of DNA gyrase (YacG/DUF329 family)